MALKNIEGLCQRLLEAGRAPTTPAALIASGTLPSQRTVLSSLGSLARETRTAGIQAPALLVVGEAAALRDQCAWFEQRPLFGRTVLVTCAQDKASRLAVLLQSLGAEVFQAPMIRIESLGGTASMREAVQQTARHDWCVFTSTHGVDAFAQALALEGLDARTFGSCRLAAVGPATNDALRALGLRADLVPDKHTGQALLDALAAEASLEGQRFLLPRSEIARPELLEGLRGRGALTHEVAAYRTHIGGTLEPQVRQALEEGRIELAAFTSASAVEGFAAALSSVPDCARKVRAAAIGPVTRQALEAASISVAVTAESSTLPGLAGAISGYFASGAGEGTP
jgi:uroporphyrinogen III methyltransferase/synthase